jgi:hypothetical protein
LAEAVFALQGIEIIIKGWNDGTKYHAQTQDDAAAQGYSQVADAKPICQSPYAPKHSKEVNDAKGIAASGFDDRREIRDGQIRGEGRHDQPGEKAADNPETFPVPAFYFFKGDVKASGREPSDEMENDTQYCIHGSAVLLGQDEILFVIAVQLLDFTDLKIDTVDDILYPPSLLSPRLLITV